MQDSTVMRGLQNDKRLHGLRIPDVNIRVEVYLSSGNNPRFRMPSNSTNLELMRLIEALSLLLHVVYHSIPTSVVGQHLGASSMDLVVLHVPVGCKQLLIVVSKHSGKDEIEPLLFGFTEA